MKHCINVNYNKIWFLLQIENRMGKSVSASFMWNNNKSYNTRVIVVPEKEEREIEGEDIGINSN